MPWLRIVVEADAAEGARRKLRFNADPVRPRRDSRARRDELHATNGFTRRRVPFKEVKHRLPIDASVAPPVPRARLFVIEDILVETAQMALHRSRLRDGDVVVFL